jgi:hypothetical protein
LLKTIIARFSASAHGGSLLRLDRIRCLIFDRIPDPGLTQRANKLDSIKAVD